jgi:hypothetical protein
MNMKNMNRFIIMVMNVNGNMNMNMNINMNINMDMDKDKNKNKDMDKDTEGLLDFQNAVMPDFPVSSQSGTGMKNSNDAGTGTVPD